MILCIDVGNAGVKIGVLDGTRVLSKERAATVQGDDIGALELCIQRAASVSLHLDGAIISSVVPEATAPIRNAVTKRTRLVPIEVSSRIELPIELAVPLPARVGSDRICAAAGALQGRRKNAIIVDVGTAITVDLVRGGRFLGGVIMAGPAASLKALATSAWQLPVVDFSAAGDPWPDNIDATEPSMLLGASLGAVGGIREAVRYLEERTGKGGRRLLTGGGAQVVSQRLSAGWTVDPDLTLRGLSRIAEFNGVGAE